MFFRYLEPILKPFRKVRTKGVQLKQIKGNVKMDVNRVKSVKNIAKTNVKGAKSGLDKANAKVGAAKGALNKGKDAEPPINPNPGVKKVGLFGRKRVCEQCNQQLDKSWDSCPYCAQAAAAQQQSAAPAMKTQAFMLDTSTGGSVQMLGWLVPVKGPLRGELFTLAPVSIIGTDASCTVVLADGYMSGQHAEIKAEGGVWMLKDLGSTNGTYVNDKRIDQQELIDNDFVKFGQSLVKFKSL